MKKLIITLTFFCFYSKTDFFKKEELHAAVGVQASSLLYKRGIITYNSYQVVPIYAVHLFNPDLLIAGSALYYKFNFHNNFFLRSRLNVDSTLDKPLYYTKEEEQDRVRRETTSELDLYLEYLSEKGSYFRFQLSQDLSAHEGRYYELRGRVPVANLYVNSKNRALIQPGVFAAIGYGDSKHNKYLYGTIPNHSGLNNIEYGVTITSPSVIDVFWPTLKFTRFQILGDENKRGSFVKESDGYQIEVLAAFKVW